MDVLARVRRTIRQHDLAGSATRVVAALSGGSDSVALAHLLRALDAAGELKLAGIAHFNHQLRASAGDDEKFCEGVSASLGLPMFAGRGDVGERAKREGRSLEAAARAARYEFFEQARAQCSADAVALGHTRDDQAETFLLRLVRGAGSRGLAGMHPRRGVFIRPLLDCRRDDLRAFLDARHVTYVTDATNADVAIPRNRVRAELLPQLEERFNPSIVDALADEAELARGEWRFVEEHARALSQKACHQVGNIWRLDAEALNAAPLALARMVMHQAMTAAANGRTIPFHHVEAALEVSRARTPSADAPGQRVERVGGFVVLTSRPEGTTGRWSSAAPPVNLFRYRLSIPGEVQLAETGSIVSAEHAPAQLAAEMPGASRECTSARIRLDRVAGPLAVRNRRPGDRFRPVGLEGRKSLQDYFVDEKVARAERDGVPIVVDHLDRILWVAGYGIDEEYRVTDPRQGVVILRLRQV